MAVTTISRFPSDPSKPLPPERAQWFTALVNAINQILTGMQSGEGSPEGIITAPQGTIYRRTDGGAGTTIYGKTSGGTDPATLTNTGWVPLT